MNNSLYATLKSIDCSQHVEKKGKFNYLSWAWAWDTLKIYCPEATFKKHVFDNLPYMTGPEGYAYVMVSVYAGEQEYTEILPVLNHQNKPIQNPNAFDVNTALQRCLVKAIAFTGLGLYIYAGEDLPTNGAGGAPEQQPESPVPLTKDEEDIRYLQDLVHQDNGNYERVYAEMKGKGVSVTEAIAAYEKKLGVK